MRIIAVVLFVLSGTVTAVADIAPHDGEFVYLRDDLSSAPARLAGSGIPLPEGAHSRTWIGPNGLEVFWKVVRDHTDFRGGRHVFYRQHALVAPYTAEITGSEIGLHYKPSGTLTSIAGAQVTALGVANTLRTTASTAADAAARSLSGVSGFGHAFLCDPIRPTARCKRTSRRGLVGTRTKDTTRRPTS